MTMTADIKKVIEQLKNERDAIRSYAQSKLESDVDYHAVADACMDIREIDAILSFLKTHAECDTTATS